MFHHLYGVLRRVLFPRWEARLPAILADGERVAASGMPPRACYREGYRAGYFDAVADLVAVGMVKEPPQATHVCEPVGLAGEAH
jgi:hypothetical protein